MRPTVAIVKGARGQKPVYRALDLVGYKNILSNSERILIKVNFITTKTWDTGATTDPLVVEAIIKKLQELQVEIQVVESDATLTNATKAFQVTGMAEMCERNDIEWINLRYLKDRVEIPIRDGLVLKKITVPRIVVESDIISAAKMKTHSETQITLGMKNMFGLLPDKLKGKFHLKGMHKVIVDINTVIKPKITVIDGFIAMEGRGPVYGKPVMMNTIIAGHNVVSTDSITSKIMGFDPQKIEHIRVAHERGLGEIDSIEVIGDSIESVKKQFKGP
jgi:uncharacterized protein (DUF362 family)